jgi:hypothetical protein
MLQCSNWVRFANFSYPHRIVVLRAIWSNPGNAGRQSNLFASYVNVGDFLMAQGNLAQALKWYREA